MRRYYEDSSKITFDRADDLVEEFIADHGDLITRVTCKDVANKLDIEESHHNLIRLNDALDDRLEVVRQSGAKATQYALEEDETGVSRSDSK